MLTEVAPLKIRGVIAERFAAKRGGVFHHKILLKTQIMNTEKMPLENENEPSCLGAVSGSVSLRDLCIGNLLLSKLPTEDNYSIVTLNYIAKNLALQYLKGIEISESLLLKLGAVKLDFKEFPSYNLKGLQINFVNNIWVEYVSQIEIKGLHHLQNIFYFRMADDLQVSCLTDR